MDRGENVLQQRIVFRARNLSEDDRHKLFEFLEVQNINEIDSELTEYEALVNPLKIMSALQAKKNTVLDEISLFSGRNDKAFEQGRKMLSEHFLAGKPRSESFIEEVNPELDKVKLLARARRIVADLNVEMLHLINNERRQNEIFLRRHKLLLLSGEPRRGPPRRPEERRRRPEERRRRPEERGKRGPSAARGSREKAAMFKGEKVDKAVMFEQVEGETVDKAAMFEQVKGERVDKAAMFEQVEGETVDKAAMFDQVKGETVDKAAMFEQVKGETVDKAVMFDGRKRKMGAEDLDKVISERDKAKASVTQVRDKINAYRIKFKALKEHKDAEDRKYRELHRREIMLLKELDEEEKPLKEYFKSLLTCSE